MNSDHALLSRLPELARRRAAGELEPAAYAGAYFLLWQIALRGGRCASRKAKSDRKPDPAAWLAQLETAGAGEMNGLLCEVLQRYQFPGVNPNVSAALLAWLRGDWRLTLTGARIPSPEEVLAMQAEGTRPVTVVADYPRLLRPVLGKPNGCAFLIHDLEHAYKFLHDPLLHAGQRIFFGGMRRALVRGAFGGYRKDARFAEKFDYLISDMNTHVVHSLRYLTAILIECLLRREERQPGEALSAAGEAELGDFLGRLGALWHFPAAASRALRRMAAGEFSAADAETVERAVLAADALV